MPELPEVETVRAGLERFAVGGLIADVRVYHDRAIRQHPGDAADFARLLGGSRVEAARRRGKFLWLPLSSGGTLLAHLGMSGQLLVRPPAGLGPVPENPHLRIGISLTDAGGGGLRLDFVDQRTFGGMWADPPPTGHGSTITAGQSVDLPMSIRHVAPDPLDPAFDEAGFIAALRAKRTEIKRALLDQRLISGIGNIYADEALWRARVHYRRSTKDLPDDTIRELLVAVREVFAEAIAAGGTSFDALYVNVNGTSGYFDRRLQAYGQAGRKCERCGTEIIREAFTNRSSFYCPACQPPPDA